MKVTKNDSLCATRRPRLGRNLRVDESPEIPESARFAAVWTSSDPADELAHVSAPDVGVNAEWQFITLSGAITKDR